jgi:hypothetical protein
MIYYFTFGQCHVHPTIDQLQMKDFWIEIEAKDSDSAREVMVKNYGNKWAFQYNEDNWNPEYFPGGCYERYKRIDL